MVRALASLLLLSSLTGCVTGRVLSEASLTLRCPEAQIQIEEKRAGAWEARGCGRMAICELPPLDRAEVSCVGGAPESKTP